MIMLNKKFSLSLSLSFHCQRKITCRVWQTCFEDEVRGLCWHDWIVGLGGSGGCLDERSALSSMDKEP